MVWVTLFRLWKALEENITLHGAQAVNSAGEIGSVSAVPAGSLRASPSRFKRVVNTLTDRLKPV
jgi:hypothetical protein